MFSFSMPVLIVGSFGILYLWLVAPRLLPARESPLADASPRIFEAVLYVHDESVAAGKTLEEVKKETEGQMQVKRIQRGKDVFLVRLPKVVIQSGDRLYISDTPENLKRYEKALGATLHNVFDLEHPVNEEHPLLAEGQQMVELVITPNSPLNRQTLRQDRFAERHQMVVMAIHRLQSSPKPIAKGLGDIVLESGDVLLAQGAAEDIAALKASGRLLVLDGTIDLPHTSRAPLALGIFAGVVVAAATGLLPILVSALVGTVLVLVTRCITWRDAADALSVQVIMIIAASLALGLALQRTGGAAYLAEMLVWLTRGLSPGFVLSGLMLLMAVLSNVVSHNAAAVIGTPIAVSIADQLGVAPAAFVLAVMFGANMGFATPIGYQTNVLILNAGGYKFTDFMRVGIPLTVIMWIGYSIMLPRFFPF